MAGSAVIGSLRVNLGLDSAQFQTGLKNAQSGLQRFGKMAAAGMAAVAAAATAMATAIAVAIRGTLQTADQMTKLAQSIGVPVAELSRLKHAAELSGVGLDTLGKGIGRLSRNMLDAEMGLKAPQRAFDALGISITNADGSMKTASQIITEVAGRFAAMKDGTEKTALAMTLFGRAGADLIPMLNAGKDGLAAMMAEADQLGIVLDQRTGRAAEAFNDNMTRLGRAWDGLVLKITAQLAPGLQLISERFVNLVRDGDNVKEIAVAIRNAFQFVAVGAAKVVGGIAGIRAELAGLAEAASLVLEGDFSGARDAWNAGQDAAVRMREEMVRAVDAVFSESQASLLVGDQSAWNDAFGNAGRAAGESFALNLGTAASSGIDKMAQEAARIFDQTRTPLERYQAAVDQATKSAEKSMLSLEQIGQTIASSIASAFQGLIDGSKKVGEVLGDLLSQLGNMLLNSAFQSIIGNLFGSGSFGTVDGFRNLIGFANGGSFAVGGAGGIDSQMVAFRATPGETVDVRKPGQERNTSGGYVDRRIFNVDARGAQQGVGKEIEAALRKYDAEVLPQRVNQIAADGRVSG